MRADRPLLVSAAFLGAGLWIIFRYGTSGAGVSAALPWANIGFHLDLALNGPAAIAGAALVAIGLLLLLWAILAALAWHASLLMDRHDDSNFLHLLPPDSSEAIEDHSSHSVSGQRQFL